MPRSKSYKISTKTYEKEQDSISFRLAVLGSGAVGKSALTIRFTNQKYVEHYDPTIEDTYRVQSKVDEKGCVLEILDTAGQTEFDSMQDQWIRGSDGYLLAFSVMDPASAEKIKLVYDKILRCHDADSAPAIIVATKCDKKNRKVSKQQGLAVAQELGLPYVETSALDNTNVNEAFHMGVREVRKVRKLHDMAAAMLKQKSRKGLFFRKLCPII